MKASVTLVFFLLASFLKGQSQSNAIKADILGILSGRYRVMYEQAFGKRISAQVGVEGGKYVSKSEGEESFKLSGRGYLVEFRYFPITKKKLAPLGLFISTSVRKIRYRELYKNGNGQDFSECGLMTPIGISTGYKFNYKRFALELLLGAESVDVNLDMKQNERFHIPDKYSSIKYDAFLRTEVSFVYLFNDNEQLTGKK